MEKSEQCIDETKEEIPEEEKETQEKEIPEEKETPEKETNALIDLSMELMMNRRQYNKYLANSNPSRFQERRRYLDKITGIRDKIISITTVMLNPDTDGGRSIYSASLCDEFESFARKCMEHLQNSNDDFVDILFDQVNR